MCIQAIFFSVIIGYILKGRLKNFEYIELKGLCFVAVTFFLQAAVILLIRKGLLQNTILVYVLHLIMYIMLFYFIYLNKKEKPLIFMGIGFLLNAIPILLNGGTMPVDMETVRSIGINVDITQRGMYNAVNSKTILWFLGDIIPKRFITNEVISIGDIVITLSLAFFIVKSMKKSSCHH